MMSNKHFSVESLFLHADHVFIYENWSHEIKTQASLFMIIYFFVKYLSVIIFIYLMSK